MYPAQASPVEVERALAAWAAFPVEASRRPVVPTGPVVLDPRDGFRTNALKDAYCAGDIVRPSRLPASPPRAGDYAVVDAATALERFENEGDHQGSPAPLRIDSVVLGSATFETDRGRL